MADIPGTAAAAGVGVTTAIKSPRVATVEGAGTSASAAILSAVGSASLTGYTQADRDFAASGVTASVAATSTTFASPSVIAAPENPSTVCTYSEVNVYSSDGSTYVDQLRFYGLRFSIGLGGGGFLSLETDARAEPILSDPDMLDDCVLMLALPLDDGDPAEVLAYANRARAGTLHSGAGLKTQRVEEAPTLWTGWAQDAVLHTEANTIPQFATAERYFGWQSTIYDHLTDPDYVWGVPGNNAGTQASPAASVRAGNPDAWPDELSHATWITKPQGASNGARHLFIKDLVVTTAAYMTVYFSADESCSVYFAGELVIRTSSSETGYQTMSTWSAWVEPGTYRVGIDKVSVRSRGGDGIDPVLLGVATNTDTGEVDDVLLVTNTSWRSYTLDPVDGIAPALTPGQIVGELYSQADARAVDTWSAIAPTFSDWADSEGKPYGPREERAWRIGYDKHLDMIEGLGDLGIDVEITPSLDLNIYADRGRDLSASVLIEALVNADSIEESGVGVEATVLYVETQDGWTELSNSSSGVGRRESSLSLGNAPSIAQGNRLGQEVLDDRLAVATSEWSVEFYASPGAVPLKSFTIGDTVSIKIGSATTKRVVLELGGQAKDDRSLIRWTAKTGEVL